MVVIVLALVSWAGDRADAAVVGYWVTAAASDSGVERYEALTRGLTAIDRKQYTRKRADAIALLYGSLLVQDGSAPRRQLCRTLTEMDGLDASVDALLRLAEAYKAAAAARKQKAPVKVDVSLSFVRNVRAVHLARDDERLADDLIASLWTRKSGGRSHFSSALIRFPPGTPAWDHGFTGSTWPSKLGAQQPKKP